MEWIKFRCAWNFENRDSKWKHCLVERKARNQRAKSQIWKFCRPKLRTHKTRISSKIYWGNSEGNLQIAEKNSATNVWWLLAQRKESQTSWRRPFSVWLLNRSRAYFRNWSIEAMKRRGNEVTLDSAIGNWSVVLEEASRVIVSWEGLTLEVKTNGVEGDSKEERSIL